MSVPNQFCGLSISKCPPNPNAIRAIVFSKDNLTVSNGSATEIQIPLSKFFIPVEDAARTSFTIPAKQPNLPFDIYKVDLAGLTTDETVKFLALLPQFGGTASTSSSCGCDNCGGTASTNIGPYLEWASIDEIEKGELYNAPIVGPSSSNLSSFNFNKVNYLEYSWGGYINAQGSTGSLWAATDGGVLNWDNSVMTMWNTLNSNLTSDLVKTLTVDSYNIVWLGNNRGLSKLINGQGIVQNWNTDNSGIVSNNVNSIKQLSPFKLVLATDNGISIFNKEDGSWKNSDMYNTPSLSTNNITSLSISGDYIILGTDIGVYVTNTLYDQDLNNWTLYNSNNSGWTAPDYITCLDSNNTSFYAGTTGGLVKFDFGSSSGTTYLAGPSGPMSDDYTALRIGSYENVGISLLYAAHSNGISIYNVDYDQWEYTESLGEAPTTLIPDFTSGATSSMNIFIGTTGSSISRLEIDSSYNSNYYNVPEQNKLANVLLTFPNNGNTKLVSIQQPLYFVFSKSMYPGNSVENCITIYDSTSTSVSGSWTWDSSYKILEFIPDNLYDRASFYRFEIVNGSVAEDGSYLRDKLNVSFYTEDIVPALGWKTLGKLMVLSGTENKYVQGLYLRNPQNTGVTVNTLIGK